jgi:hypothetical protein
MQTVSDDGQPAAPTAIGNDLGAIFASLELSRSTWLINIAISGRRRENVEGLGARRAMSPVLQAFA